MKLLLIPMIFAASFLASAQPRPPIVRETRVVLARGDFEGAVRRVEDYAAREGRNAAWLEAHSWLARNRLAAKEYGAANEIAQRTRDAALEILKSRDLDNETSLPLALGASIEVQAQALHSQGQTSEAVAFLQEEVARWRETSIRTRIQKNLNLITLEGKPAPAIEMNEWLGARPPALETLRGKTVILFFWAHWCGDCKQQAPALAQLKAEFGERLAIVGPTQPYGYVAGGEEATREDELKYIETIRARHFGEIPGLSVPVSEETFRNWGASTTPTLSVIDPSGIVRLYHPGKLTYEQLRPYIAQTLRTD